MMRNPVRLSLAAAHTLALQALLGSGVSAAHADAIAGNVMAAERDGCAAHGLFRLPGYIRSVQNLKVSRDAVPQINDLAPAVLQVDGNNGFAPLALRVGQRSLVDKARRCGIAAMAVTRIYHFGALWVEVEALALEGLVAFAFTQSSSAVAPAGATKPLFGTNPMAFAWPRVGRPPLVFDQASSMTARGELLLHLRDGKAIPEGWAVDSTGGATTDAAAALAGAQLPFGGYKGASIALMIELLAGALIGEAFGFEAAARDNNDGGPALGGELIIAIDPAHFMAQGSSEQQLAHAELLFARILGLEGARLPSDRRYAARERSLLEGILIPGALHAELLGMVNAGGLAT